MFVLFSDCDRVYIICDVMFFFQAEDGIRDLVRSRGLGDVYKRQEYGSVLLHVSGIQGTRRQTIYLFHVWYHGAILEEIF